MNIIQNHAMMLCLIAASFTTQADINGVDLTCQFTSSKSSTNAYQISINYDLGMAVYLSPNKMLSTIYPGESFDSFFAHKDISSIAITPRLTILETVSVNKDNSLSWYNKKIIETGLDNTITLIEYSGSNPRSVSNKKISTCVPAV